jgi:hypothetical protein
MAKSRYFIIDDSQSDAVNFVEFDTEVETVTWLNDRVNNLKFPASIKSFRLIVGVEMDLATVVRAVSVEIRVPKDRDE